MSEPVAFPSFTPIFAVEDLAASLRHYVEALGFERSWAWSAEEGFETEAPTFACVCRGQLSLFLGHQCQGVPGAWLSVHLESLEDLAALEAEYQASGARIVEPAEDRPWGLREMRVEDLDGNTFRFGAPTGVGGIGGGKD